MRERPILMSAPMVRAILAGAKTQTRRVVNWASALSQSDGRKRRVFTSNDVPEMNELLRHRQESPLRRMCPYGEVGGKLWVRETWAQNENQLSETCMDTSIVYRADGEARAVDNGGEKPWRPSIHMPRWASRITLEITDVRVERLRDISEEDCVAEGMTPTTTARALAREKLPPPAYTQYADLWASIYGPGPGSWDANPWVWAITFRRIGDA